MGRLPSTVVLAGVLAGCHDPVTEGGVVMQSDLVIPVDADRVLVAYNPGPLPPMSGNFETMTVGDNVDSRSFPISIGFTSAGGTPDFSITVQLLHGVNQFGAPNI